VEGIVEFAFAVSASVRTAAAIHALGLDFEILEILGFVFEVGQFFVD